MLGYERLFLFVETLHCNLQNLSMTRAFVTLVAVDLAAPSALVLAHRLRDLHDSRNSSPRLACVLSSDVTPETRHALATVFDDMFQVDAPRSKAAMNLHLAGKPDVALSLIKIGIWQLVQYEKVVYLDPDVLPLRSIDELFELDELSAAPDIGWPDWFNTSVFVARPSMETYTDLKDLTEEDRVINGLWSIWQNGEKHLSYVAKRVLNYW